jgi:hypothetical protein
LIGCPATITCPPQTLAFGCPKTITCPPHTIPFLHCPPIRSRFPWTCPITMRPPCLTITAPINTLACPDPRRAWPPWGVRRPSRRTRKPSH